MFHIELCYEDVPHTIFKKKVSVSYLGPKIWSQVPDKIKSLESLEF